MSSIIFALFLLTVICIYITVASLIIRGVIFIAEHLTQDKGEQK